MSTISKRIVISMISVLMLYLVGIFFVSFVDMVAPVFSVVEWDRGARFFFFVFSMFAIIITNVLVEV